MLKQHGITVWYPIGKVPVIASQRSTSILVGCCYDIDQGKGKIKLRNVRIYLSMSKTSIFVYFPSTNPSVADIIKNAGAEFKRQHSPTTGEEYSLGVMDILRRPAYQRLLENAGLETLPSDHISRLGSQLLLYQTSFEQQCRCLCPNMQCSETFRNAFSGIYAFCSAECTDDYHNRRPGSAGAGLRESLIDDPFSQQQGVLVSDSVLYSRENHRPLLSGRLLTLFCEGPGQTELLDAARSSAEGHDEDQSSR